MNGKIKVPDAMLKAGMQARNAAFMGDESRVRDILEAALRWLSDNPITPTGEQLQVFRVRWDSEDWNQTQANRGDFFRWCLLEWQRRMFIEPEVPEAIKDLMWSAAREGRIMTDVHVTDEQIKKASEAARLANRELGATWETIVRAAAPYLQAQPQPVDEEIVDAMCYAYCLNNPTTGLSADKFAMAAALHVAADRLLAEPTKEECALMYRGGTSCQDDLAAVLANRRASLSTKKTPEDTLSQRISEVADILRLNYEDAERLIAALRESEGKR